MAKKNSNIPTATATQNDIENFFSAFEATLENIAANSDGAEKSTNILLHGIAKFVLFTMSKEHWTTLAEKLDKLNGLLKSNAILQRNAANIRKALLAFCGAYLKDMTTGQLTRADFPVLEYDAKLGWNVNLANREPARANYEISYLAKGMGRDGNVKTIYCNYASLKYAKAENAEQFSVAKELKKAKANAARVESLLESGLVNVIDTEKARRLVEMFKDMATMLDA